MAQPAVSRDDAIRDPGHCGAGCESLRCGSQSSEKKDLRESLYDALRPVAGLGSVDDASYSAQLVYLLRQTAVWADIVRCRIENSRNSIVSTPVAAIQHPARDLQQFLARLVDELNGPASPDS